MVFVPFQNCPYPDPDFDPSQFQQWSVLVTFFINLSCVFIAFNLCHCVYVVNLSPSTRLSNPLIDLFVSHFAPPPEQVKNPCRLEKLSPFRALFQQRPPQAISSFCPPPQYGTHPVNHALALRNMSRQFDAESLPAVVPKFWQCHSRHYLLFNRRR